MGISLSPSYKWKWTIERAGWCRKTSFLPYFFTGCVSPQLFVFGWCRCRLVRSCFFWIADWWHTENRTKSKMSIFRYVNDTSMALPFPNPPAFLVSLRSRFFLRSQTKIPLNVWCSFRDMSHGGRRPHPNGSIFSFTLQGGPPTIYT